MNNIYIFDVLNSLGIHYAEPNIIVCRKCYQFKGYLEEEFNGVVHFLCSCKENQIKKKKKTPAYLIGGIFNRGEIGIRWAPGSKVITQKGIIKEEPYDKNILHTGTEKDLLKLENFIIKQKLNKKYERNLLNQQQKEKNEFINKIQLFEIKVIKGEFSINGFKEELVATIKSIYSPKKKSIDVSNYLDTVLSNLLERDDNRTDMLQIFWNLINDNATDNLIICHIVHRLMSRSKITEIKEFLFKILDKGSKPAQKAMFYYTCPGNAISIIRSKKFKRAIVNYMNTDFTEEALSNYNRAKYKDTFSTKIPYTYVDCFDFSFIDDDFTKSLTRYKYYKLLRKRRIESIAILDNKLIKMDMIRHYVYEVFYPNYISRFIKLMIKSFPEMKKDLKKNISSR